MSDFCMISRQESRETAWGTACSDPSLLLAPTPKKPSFDGFLIYTGRITARIGYPTYRSDAHGVTPQSPFSPANHPGTAEVSRKSELGSNLYLFITGQEILKGEK
jgi:hypothetical protein